MNLIIKRVMQNTRETVGVAILSDGCDDVIIGVTLELPWRFNATNVSCIPHGYYPAHKRAASKGKTGGLGIAYELQVHGRDAILIHVGNETSDSAGCLLLGSATKTEEGRTKVINSKAAFKQFMGAVEDKDILYVDVQDHF